MLYDNIYIKCLVLGYRLFILCLWSVVIFLILENKRYDTLTQKIIRKLFYVNSKYLN